MKSDSFVSILIILDQPVGNYKDQLRLIHHELDSHYTDYEMVLIGQGPIKPYTPQDESVFKSLPSIRHIQLASRVSDDITWSVALENAIGDFIVLFNPAADPVQTITETVNLCKGGHDIVIGVAPQPRTLVYKLFRPIAAFILKQIDYSLPQNATSLRCLSRRTVNAVTATGRFHHQVSMRMQKTGYPYCVYNYKLAHPLLPSRSFWFAFQDLIRLLVFNSFKPLRWMSFVGLMGSLAAFIFASYSILIHFIKGHVVEGWTTTILFMSTMFMLMFLMLAFFGEYLGRLLNDQGERDDHSVVFEKNSTVMVNRDRVNVLNQPTDDNLNPLTKPLSR